MTDHELQHPDAEPLAPGPDLKGIPVDDVEDRPAGVVFGSLSESRSGLVRYLDVELHRNPVHVLVPVGHARLRHELGQPRFKLRAATRTDLAGIPSHDPSHGAPTEPDEAALLAAHRRLFHGERYYAHPAYDHSGLYAGEHPIVRDGESEVADGSLEFLGNLRKYRVVEGESDIRGWDLTTRSGVPIGRIGDLVVDTTSDAVRYAFVHPPESDAGWFLPVGFLEIDRAGLRVFAAGLTAADLETLPAAPARTLSRAEELAVLEALEQRLSGPRRFDRPDFRNHGPVEQEHA